MSNKRLDALAIGYICHDRSPSPDEILKMWDISGTQRIAIAFSA